MAKYLRKETKQKKPITKRWWFWTLLVFFGLGVIGNILGLSGDPEEVYMVETTTPASTEAFTEAVPTDESETTAPTTASALPFDVTYYDSFMNDNTGNWRRAMISTTETIDKFAFDYYKEYFKSDDEVHIIYNTYLDTVNSLRMASGMLFVSITEYVDGEENDAQKACSGMYYGQYQFDASTGELLYSSFDSNK